MKKTFLKTSGIATLVVSAGLIGNALAAPAPRVLINGQPLRTDSPAFVENNRVLVPMRDIFESLGAEVSYNNLDRTISAQRGTTIVRMAIGSRNASVNNVPVTLDVPANTYSGSTYVPLRFVSEAMGADVNFNPYQSLVSIQGQGYHGGNGSGSQVAGIQQISIPANAVIRVSLDQDLSSATAFRGQTFSSTVVSQQNGDSEFPAGTKIQGRVASVSRKAGNNPGTLELDFDSAVLPDNSSVPIDGTLISLDNDSVQNVDGRVVAKGGKKNDTLKVVGIGAGAGFVIGRLLKKDGALSAILGAAGGFLYDRSKNKNKAAEATLASGTQLGVRLQNSVVYRDTTGYSTYRGNHVRL